MIKVYDGKPPFVSMDDEEYGRVSDLVKDVEYYEIQNMVHHMLRAEDLVRGVFPKVSLEVRFINLYNLSHLREGAAMIAATAPVTGQPQTAGDGRTPDDGAGRQVMRREESPSQEEHPPAGPSEQVKKRQEPTEKPVETAGATPPAPEPEHTPAGPPATTPRPDSLVAYLKEKSKMLYGIFAPLEIAVRENVVTVYLTRETVYIRQNSGIVNELKEHASAFFGREMAVRFDDGSEAGGEETLDDYVREAERLFNA